jgi:hypothetical protein
MLVDYKCKKCECIGTLDIGDLTREQVEAKMKEIKSFHCDPGNHMEISSPTNYWTIDWDTLREGSSMTEEQFVDYLKGKFDEVIHYEEVQKKYKILGFLGGVVAAMEIKTNNPCNLFYYHSPKGTRYYVR